MWDQRVELEVGDRTHRLIGELVTGAATSPGDAARRVLAARPVSGTRAASVRMRMASAASTYKLRFQPPAALVGVEVPLGAGVADLVWERPDGMVVVDEVKSGAITADDRRLIAQVARLVAGGHARWGELFVGVRVCPLRRPARTVLAVGAAGGRLVTVVLPGWLEVR